MKDKEADNTQQIQNAIDEVGKYALTPEGFRGIVLLKAGRYNIDGTLNLTYDGVILRGEGNCFSDQDSTGTKPSGTAVIPSETPTKARSGRRKTSTSPTIATSPR